jgi:hypothetical protein
LALSSLLSLLSGPERATVSVEGGVTVAADAIVALAEGMLDGETPVATAEVATDGAEETAPPEGAPRTSEDSDRERDCARAASALVSTRLSSSLFAFCSTANAASLRSFSACTSSDFFCNNSTRSLRFASFAEAVAVEAEDDGDGPVIEEEAGTAAAEPFAGSAAPELGFDCDSGRAAAASN